mmetsp:Transcript_34066/g.77688  ORF Transcript_34066/g.77688 Transcript_34066/m.77688 type:complete len:647 (-) Transcript_34066:24-1964(-)
MNFYPALRVPRAQPQRTGGLNSFTPERGQASLADDASIVSGRSTRWTPEGDSAQKGRVSYYPALKLNNIPSLAESNAIETSTTATAQSSGFDTAGFSDRFEGQQPPHSPAHAGTYADCDGLGFVESPRNGSTAHSMPRSFMAAVPSSTSLTRVADLPPSTAGAVMEGTDGEVEVRGSQRVPRAWATWEDVRFPQRLLEPLRKAGFPAPTVIQQTAWPIVAQGSDLIGIAKTGSGKTLAFLLPAFARLIETNADPRGPPAILVLAPTRELAVQIEAQAASFGGPAGMKATCLYGGAPKGPQLAQLRMRPQAVVATPGRLNDLLDPAPGLTLAVDVKSIKFLILDEADRMLDMGFEPQIRKIFSFLPKERQTMMFTATWPAAVRRLGGEFLRDPMEIRIGDADVLVVNPDIEQHVIFCDTLEKDRRLEELLREAGEDQVIVFASTKRTCDLVAYRTPGSVAIHGDKDQQARDAALGAFKSGSRKVLIATDVAARGLDIKAVRLVINYDPPPREEDYVHRVGRTGRAGMKGKAVSLLTNEDAAAARSIAEVLKRGGLPVPEELSRRLASGEMRSGRDPSRPRPRPGLSNPTPTFVGGGGGRGPSFGGGSFGGSRGGFAFGSGDIDLDGFGRAPQRMDDLPTSYNDCPTW